MRRYSCLVSLVVSCACSTTAYTQPEKTDIFVAGEHGYVEFRIPSLVVTQSGTLLAFTEAGHVTADAGNRDILLKRSEDGGRTWSRQVQTIIDAGESRTGSPCGLVDQKSGRVHLITAIDEKKVIHFHSDDDGLTWSAPRSLDYALEAFRDRADWASLDTGPGEGIECERGAHAGRFIVPIYLGVRGIGSRSTFIYSDDRGETWKPGGLSDPKFDANEATIHEGVDGTLHMNMRAGSGIPNREPYRLVAESRDGGITWSETRVDRNLWTPHCHASTLRYSWPEEEHGIVLFAGPFDKAKRVNFNVLASFDDGATWPVRRQIFPGPTAYTSIVRLPDGDIGAIYEGGYFRYAKFIFVRFSLEWLLAGGGDVSPPHLPPERKRFKNSIGMELIPVPAGAFLMGAAPGEEQNLDANESPKHRVELTRGFFMSAHEVTQAQYAALTGNNPCVLNRGDRLPVSHVGPMPWRFAMR